MQPAVLAALALDLQFLVALSPDQEVLEGFGQIIVDAAVRLFASITIYIHLLGKPS